MSSGGATRSTSTSTGLPSSLAGAWACLTCPLDDARGGRRSCRTTRLIGAGTATWFTPDMGGRARRPPTTVEKWVVGTRSVWFDRAGGRAAITGGRLRAVGCPSCNILAGPATGSRPVSKGRSTGSKSVRRASFLPGVTVPQVAVKMHISGAALVGGCALEKRSGSLFSQPSINPNTLALSVHPIAASVRGGQRSPPGGLISPLDRLE
jgi:hypothetical protein